MNEDYYCFLLNKHHRLHEPCHTPERLASWATLLAAYIFGYQAYRSFLQYRKDGARWRLLLGTGFGLIGLLFLYSGVTFLLYPR